MRRSLAGLCLAVAVAVSVAACGTTVPSASRTVNTTESELGDGPAVDRSASADVTTGTTGSVAAGAARAGSGASTTVLGHTGRGVTASTITIGLAVATGTDALATALGLSGAPTVSTRILADAVIADVNRTGGVLGRKLAVQVHNFDGTAYTSNPAQTFSEICADFRDDHKVFAVVFNVADPAIRKCLADMGSPLIISGTWSLPAKAYTENGANYVYGVDATTVDRLAQLFIKSLMDRGFTTKWDIANGKPGVLPVKLGLIHVDNPDTNLLYALYAKELAKYGLRFAETVTYPQNLQAGLAATSAAILRFRSAGVTHVFGASGFFLQAAEVQHYRPRYAYLPGLGQFGVENVPAEQMRGALTVGWAPAVDVNTGQDPGTPGAKHCLDVMRAHGVQPVNRQDLAATYAICDAVYGLRAALNAGKSATVAGLRRGYESLGTGFVPALTFGSSLGPNRHYGIDYVRDLAFDGRCSCLVYASRTNRS